MHDETVGADTELPEMVVSDISATVSRDESGWPIAQVTLTLANGDEVEFTIHQSLHVVAAINVEIDGSFADDYPSLRIHMNDGLIVDTAAMAAEADASI